MRTCTQTGDTASKEISRCARSTAGTFLAVIAFIAIIYWPTVHAGFVWDDEIDFVKNNWLTQGHQWQHYVLKDFHGWRNYFRPLVVALFAAQLRLFEVSSGAMHAVSLLVHLMNTVLVGLLAMRCSKTTELAPTLRTLLPAISMLAYGLHGANIEPVAWIASQFDLFATLFMLLGLVASQYLGGRITKPAAVAICFFLAGCSKESAAAFPLILVTFDWALQDRKQGTKAPNVGSFLAKNAITYTAVFTAGLAYLAFRSWALGSGALPALSSDSTWLGNFEASAFAYMRYWMMVFMPSAGMNPLHPFDPAIFEVATPRSFALDAAALAMIASSLWLAVQRHSALACMVLAMTFSILPVLRILPTHFDGELYHDRYLMTGLASICAMLPLLVTRVPSSLKEMCSLRLAVGVLALAWCMTSILTIRVTLPMWASSVTLWQWALANDPTSTRAANALMIAYLDRGGVAEARELGDWILQKNLPCANCLLDITALALQENDITRARLALSKASGLEQEIFVNRYFHEKYLELTQRLRQQDVNGAATDAKAPAKSEASPD